MNKIQIVQVTGVIRGNVDLQHTNFKMLLL